MPHEARHAAPSALGESLAAHHPPSLSKQVNKSRYCFRSSASHVHPTCIPRAPRVPARAPPLASRLHLASSSSAPHACLACILRAPCMPAHAPCVHLVHLACTSSTPRVRRVGAVRAPRVLVVIGSRSCSRRHGPALHFARTPRVQLVGALRAPRVLVVISSRSCSRRHRLASHSYACIGTFATTCSGSSGCVSMRAFACGPVCVYRHVCFRIR